ncbi:MAG TPA: hypothetical protein VMV29_03990, partial [Ktedonobacterales bacterium]|nr:hypothetical protein [Ktedonobacterales bacterium]
MDIRNVGALNGASLAFQGLQEPPQVQGEQATGATRASSAAPTSHINGKRPPGKRPPQPPEQSPTARLSVWRQRLATLRALDGSPRASNRVLFAVWAITRVLLMLSVIIGHAYTDPQFYHYAGQLAVGQFPYRDIPVEYPPLAMALILLPALPLLLFPGIAPRPDAAFLHVVQLPHPLDPTRYGAYAISFAVEMLIVDAVTLWLVRRAARRLTPGDANGLRAGLFYLALTFASGALLQKFDLIVGTLCLAAALALVERRRGLAWSLLAAATLVKGFPLLVVPVFALYEFERAGAGAHPYRLTSVLRAAWRPIAIGLAWFVGVLLAFGLAISLFGGPGSLIHAVVSQTGRDFEIESLYANLMLALGWLPGLAVQTTFRSAVLSRIVLSPLAVYLAPVATAILLVAIVAVYALLTRGALLRARRTAPAVGADARTDAPGASATRASGGPTTGAPDGMTAARALLVGTTLITLTFLLLYPALPAHYLLAILPLAPLLWLGTPRRNWLWLSAVAAVALLGQVVTINAIWQSIVALRPWAIGVLTLRNLAWLTAFGALVAAAWALAPSSRRARAGPLAPAAERAGTAGAALPATPGVTAAAPGELAAAPGATGATGATGRAAPRDIPAWRLVRLRRRLILAWRRLARSAPPIPGFTPRGEDIFAHLLSQVSPLRLILVAGASSVIMYLGFVFAFPIVIFYNQPHVGRESSIINDIGAITGYSPLAAIAFVSAVLTLIACQFMALLAASRVTQRTTDEAETAAERDEVNRRANWMERRVRWAVLGFPLVFSAVMIWMQPVTTTDLYGYVARGYLYAHLGQNPLVTAAYQLPGGLSVDRPPAPYGPLWIMITWVVSKLCGENLLANMLVYKVIGAVSVALTLLLVDRLAGRFYPDRRLRVDVLFGWSPLLIFEAVGNGHNDIVMMLCVLLAISLMLRGRAQLAFAFIVMGALIKYVSAVLAPLWLVYELRHHVRQRADARQRATDAMSAALVASASPVASITTGAPDETTGATETPDETASEGFADAARRIARDTVRAAGEVDRKAALRLIAGATVIGGALTIVCYAPFWVGLHTFTGLGSQLRPLYYNDSLAAFISGPLQLLVPASKLTALDKTVRLVFYALFALYVALQTHKLWTLGPRADLRDFITASAKVLFAALVLITFWFQPWYVVWLLPLAPLAREPFVRRQATIFAAGALLTYAIGAYLLIDEAGTTLRDLTVQFFEILVTFGPLLLLRTAPAEGGWGRRARRYLGLLGEGVNQRPLFWERVMLAMVLIVAVLLRLLGLGALTAQLPTGASNVDALKAVSADLRLFLTDPQGLHGPFVAAQGLLVRILGPTPLAALLPSAVIGALTVLAIYLLAVEIMRQGRLPGQRVVGILAALLAATSQWHISLSRSGMEVVLLPLLMCLAVYCLLVAFRLRMEAVDAAKAASATDATGVSSATGPTVAVAPRASMRAPHRRSRRALAWALRRSRALRSLYRVTLLPLARQARRGAPAAIARPTLGDAEANGVAGAAPAQTRDHWPTILALNVACGVCAGLIFDLAPGLWLSPLLIIGFLVIWRWREPQIFSRIWLGLFTLIGGTLLASLPALWLFVNQRIGFPVGATFLARSSVGQSNGPSVFSALFWQRVLANAGNVFSLLTSQNYSAAYPAAGNAPIIPSVLGPFFLIGALILIYRWRSLTSLAALLLVAAPLIASVAVSAPTSVIEAASVLPAMCILPAIALYQIGAFLGSLPIVLDRLHGVRVFTTPEQIGRLALLVFLLVSTIRTFFWLFEATLPSQPGVGLPSFVAPALA